MGLPPEERVTIQLADEVSAVMDLLNQLREEAQILLRGPMNSDTTVQLTGIRRSMIRLHGSLTPRSRPRQSFLVRTGGTTYGMDLYREVALSRVADGIVYLDLALKAIDRATVPDPAGSTVGDARGIDFRPNPAGARTPAELVAVLRDFRVWAGEPSYREMSDRNRGKPAASTICTALRSGELPKFDMVAAVVTGCGGGKEDLERFASAWRAVRTGMQPLPVRPRDEADVRDACGKLHQLAARHVAEAAS